MDFLPSMTSEMHGYARKNLEGKRLPKQCADVIMITIRKGWFENMKKCIVLLLVLAAISVLLCSCGMIIVEDAQPVEIGLELRDRRLTERC